MVQRLEDCGDQPLDPWRFCAIDGRSTRLLEHDTHWQKLEELLKRFRGLRNLTWGCAEQMPSCILRHIHENLPQCRVHMRNFSLRSLVQPPQIPINIDPHELAIATSPCLYSVAMKYDYMYSDCACQFDSLDTLVIKPDLTVEDTMEELADATENFLLSLPPLRKLKLTGLYQQRTAISAINHSNGLLQQLHLALVNDQSGSVPEPSSLGFANPDFLHTLQRKCPVLEDLSLCISPGRC